MLTVSLNSETVALPAAEPDELPMLEAPAFWSVGPVSSAAANVSEQMERTAVWVPLPEKPKPIYFTAQELHLRPSPIGTVLQEEPGRIYWDSKTYLRILINEQGLVDHAEILDTTNPVFAQEVLQAFAKARYIPGAIAARKVHSELRVEVLSSNNLGMTIKPLD